MPEEISVTSEAGNGYLSVKNGNGIKIRKNDQSFSSLGSSPPRTSSPTLSVMESFNYETIADIANYLLHKTKFRPKIGIICGSGLGHLAENLTSADSFAYEDIPNFPVSTVQGHAGKMIFGLLNGVEVMAMQGRFHYYEGYPLAKCAMPVRVMKLVGVSHLIATNAAGGLNDSYQVGDIMVVKDHVNIMGFAGNSPLQGPNDVRFGPRFPPMSRAYDPELIKIALDVAKEMGKGEEIHSGVYTCLGGPNYETVAELKMWKLLGVDAVGMSTVHEVITARHCDMKVFAFSLITNKCVTDYDSLEAANHDEVMGIGALRQDTMTEFVTKMVYKINIDSL